MNVAELFPDEEYRFRLGLRRGDPATFFRPRDSSGRLLAERAHWLATDRGRYAWLEPEGTPLLEAFCRELVWPAATLLQLGSQLEPDVLFLSPDAEGAFRLRGGVLCFPTGWALREKIGATLEEVHGVVPGLNRALGPALSRFLWRLVPGEAWLRANWGLAATAERNLHPALGRPVPEPPVHLDRLWLRVEEQLLAALPGSPGLVFAIRIELVRLDDLVRDPTVAAGLARALRSMPAELAVYKRIEAIREPLLARLRA